MRDFLVLTLIKSKGFNLILDKVSTRFKLKLVETCDEPKHINLIFVEPSNIDSLIGLDKNLPIIGVTSSQSDLEEFYKKDIFLIIPENITEKQLEVIINKQLALQGFDLFKLAFKKNKSFAFENFTYYIETVFINSTLGVAFLSKDMQILIFNPIFAKIFHNIYNESPVIGKPIYNNLTNKNKDYWHKIIEECSSCSEECANLKGKWDDKRKHYQMQITPIMKISSMIGYAIVIKDVSQFTNANADLKRYYKYLLEQNTRLEQAYKELEVNNAKLKIAYEKVNALSNHDYLTQAPNRKYFLEKIEYEQLRFKRTKNPFILVYCDIDDFKIVNDHYGHETGDYVLISLCNLIKTTIRDIDFFCRWGGEEFLIFLAESDLKIGKTIVERLLQKIRNYEFNYNGKSIKITMTFGLAVYDKDQHINEIINIADKKLYWGKGHNKNQVVDIIPDT